MLGVSIHARRGKKDFSQLAHNTHRVLGYKVRQALDAMRTRAIELAPEKTGALKSSIVVFGGPGYRGVTDLNQVMLEIWGLNPDARITETPDIELLDDLHGIVMCLVHYGIFQEYGTSRNPPHPFMGPAAMEIAPEFRRSLIGVFSQYEKTGEIVQSSEMFEYMQADLDIEDLG